MLKDVSGNVEGSIWQQVLFLAFFSSLIWPFFEVGQNILLILFSAERTLICFYFISFRYGEVVPLGSNYLPSYAEGVRTGIKELGPKLLGLDPRETRVIYSVMDYELKGHPYVKSPIDMACWDILGKVT